jgi:hypothetical protein
MTPDSDEAKARRATLLARKMQQAEEGRAAMADYQRDQQAAVSRIATLKALRLAQQPEPVEVKPAKAKAVRKKSA